MSRLLRTMVVRRQLSTLGTWLARVRRSMMRGMVAAVKHLAEEVAEEEEDSIRTMVSRCSRLQELT